MSNSGFLPPSPSACMLPEHCQCTRGHDPVDMIYEEVHDTFYCPVCEWVYDAYRFRIAVWEQLHGRPWPPIVPIKEAL